MGPEAMKEFDRLRERCLLDPAAESFMTPNRGRLGLLGRLVQEYQVQGVVDLT